MKNLVEIFDTKDIFNHFKEDWSKSKKDNIIQNLALLRKICYNLVKLDASLGNISFKKKLNRYN